MMKRKMNETERNSAKRLRFSEFSSLILTEPKSSDDAKQSWYTKKEMAQFRKNVLLESQALRGTRTAKIMKHIAHSVATGSPNDELIVHNKERILGIEQFLSPETLKVLMVRRARHRTRVLEVQKEAGKYIDQSIIAKVSMVSSSFSREWCSRITHFQHA